MHIHANNNLQLASIGSGREQAQEIAAKRAAEVRRKLSAASRSMALDQAEFSGTARVEARSYEGEQRKAEDDAFGRLFSAKA